LVYATTAFGIEDDGGGNERAALVDLREATCLR
jgi:hypothetical protein